MKDPAEAVRTARERAAAQPYDEATPSLDASPVTRVSDKRLVEWSLIEPTTERVYSTRALGAPITGVKRLLVRMLQQYVGDVTAQQSRFNAQATAHILNLEERVAELEDELRRRDAT